MEKLNKRKSIEKSFEIARDNFYKPKLNFFKVKYSNFWEQKECNPEKPKKRLCEFQNIFKIYKQLRFLALNNEMVYVSYIIQYLINLLKENDGQKTEDIIEKMFDYKNNEINGIKCAYGLVQLMIFKNVDKEHHTDLMTKNRLSITRTKMQDKLLINFILEKETKYFKRQGNKYGSLSCFTREYRRFDSLSLNPFNDPENIFKEKIIIQYDASSGISTVLCSEKTKYFCNGNFH